MDIKQIQKFKEAFFNLEAALAKSTAPEKLFADNPQVATAFDIAHKKIGEFENGGLMERTLAYNLCDSVRNVIEELERIGAYIKLNLRPDDATSLEERLQEAKEILARQNYLFGLIGHYK